VKSIGEDVLKSHDNSVPLLIDPQVQELMDERGFRDENLRQVLSCAEQENLYHTCKNTGHKLAYLSVSKVTYWVKFIQEDKGYRIFTAYSHRMKILEGFNMPPKNEPEESDWHCAACDVPLESAAVKLAYLDETFAVDLPACPSCQRVLVSEKIAVEKMALAERMLEDK